MRTGGDIFFSKERGYGDVGKEILSFKHMRDKLPELEYESELLFPASHDSKNEKEAERSNRSGQYHMHSLADLVYLRFSQRHPGWKI